MPITVPTVGAEISVTDFGAPVANQLNTLIPTQWTVLPYTTNWGANSGNPATYRKVGDIVYVQGGIVWSGGTVADGPQLICTLPVGYRPASQRRFVAWLNNTGAPKRISADTNGQVYMDTPLTNQHSWEISLIYSTVG